MSDKNNLWKPIAIAAICVIAVESICYGMGIGWKDSKDRTAENNPQSAATTTESNLTSDEQPLTTSPKEELPEEEKTADTPLSLWTDDAKAKKELTEYITAITAQGSEDYIPPEDRIAVFDLDGTLFCETDPNYFDYTLLKYRVLDDPDYKDKASEFEKMTAEKIKIQNETGESFEGLETDHGKAVASAFSGMTIDSILSLMTTLSRL